MAQDVKKLVDTPKEEEPLFKSIEIGVDVGGLAQKVFGSDYTSVSASITANIKNRYMPVIEIGYGKINTINESNSVAYDTKAPFIKVGADYNFFYKKPYLPGFLYGGIRICTPLFHTIYLHQRWEILYGEISQFRTLTAV
nr:DUF6048 family protein [Phocaeicola paurosaccharolyticus]